MKIASAVRRLISSLRPKMPSAIQVLGAGCLIAAATVAWGLAPGLAAGGAALIVFGIAAEGGE